MLLRLEATTLGAAQNVLPYRTIKQTFVMYHVMYHLYLSPSGAKLAKRGRRTYAPNVSSADKEEEDDITQSLKPYHVGFLPQDR